MLYPTSDTSIPCRSPNVEIAYYYCGPYEDNYVYPSNNLVPDELPAISNFEGYNTESSWVPNQGSFIEAPYSDVNVLPPSHEISYIDPGTLVKNESWVSDMDQDDFSTAPLLTNQNTSYYEHPTVTIPSPILNYEGSYLNTEHSNDWNPNTMELSNYTMDQPSGIDITHCMERYSSPSWLLSSTDRISTLDTVQPTHNEPIYPIIEESDETRNVYTWETYFENTDRYVLSNTEQTLTLGDAVTYHETFLTSNPEKYNQINKEINPLSESQVTNPPINTKSNVPLKKRKFIPVPPALERDVPPYIIRSDGDSARAPRKHLCSANTSKKTSTTQESETEEQDQNTVYYQYSIADSIEYKIELMIKNTPNNAMDSESTDNANKTIDIDEYKEGSLVDDVISEIRRKQESIERLKSSEATNKGGEVMNEMSQSRSSVICFTREAE